MSRTAKIISTLLRYQVLAFVLVALPHLAEAQDEDTFQPDSIYQARKVKTIYVYENSTKDLAKVIELDTNGHKVKIANYSASYDRLSRMRKRIDSYVRYIYDSEKKLIEVIDSSNRSMPEDQTDRTYFFYDTTGVLKVSKYYKRKYLYSQTDYSFNPLKAIETRRNDSLLIAIRTTEYDKDFYDKRWYGYAWEPTLKHGYTFKGTDTLRYGYTDQKDLRKLENYTEITNSFNSKGQLVSAYTNQRFMTDTDVWRTFKSTVIYNYYHNGLLKSVRGYIPEYFKYEFYK